MQWSLPWVQSYFIDAISVLQPMVKQLCPHVFRDVLIGQGQGPSLCKRSKHKYLTTLKGTREGGITTPSPQPELGFHEGHPLVECGLLLACGLLVWT